MKNWKTTLGGIGTMLGGAATAIGGFLHEPRDINVILAGIAVIGGGFTLLFAKDFDKTNAAVISSETKAVPPEKQ